MNQADLSGRTPLHNASWGKDGGRGGFKTSLNGRDSPECVKMLFEHGANCMIADNKGNTSIHTASNTNAPESLDLMLSHGADVNITNKFGSTPLHKAGKYGNFECMKVLFKHGVIVDSEDSRGFHGVDYLLIGGKYATLCKLFEMTEFPEVSKYLEKHLTSVRSLQFCIDNDKSECLLLLFQKYNYSEIVDQQLLLRRALILNSANCVEALLKMGNIKLTGIELELVIYFMKAEIVSKLFSMYYREADNKFLEERVIKAAIFTKHHEYIKELISFSTDCREEHNAVIAQVEKVDWNTALTGNLLNLKFLKSKNINIPMINFNELYQEYNNNNILQYAIEKDEEDIASLLLETNVNLDTLRTQDKATSLILGTKKYQHDTVERIIKKYYDIYKDRTKVQSYIEQKDNNQLSVIDLA